jgi:hypothetical protein
MRLKMSLATIAATALAAASPCFGQANGTIDLSKTAVIMPFENKVEDSRSAGLPQATQTAVLEALKIEKMFARVMTPEEAGGTQENTRLEISGTLVSFDAGSTAKRLLVGFGSGRAHATFDISIKDTTSGNVVWQRTIKKNASLWTGGSSSTQRLVLPQSFADELIKQLRKDLGIKKKK